MEDGLTADELSFLASQGLGPDDVYDARGLPKNYWQSAAKDEGKRIILGNPCDKGGHRIRSRSGHCAQCDTSKLAFAGTNDFPQYVYIAGSVQARLVKVGLCVNLQQRLRQIRAERHGKSADWEILHAVHIANAGDVERSVLAGLSAFMVDEYYWKNGKWQKSIEVRRCRYSLVLERLNSVIANTKHDLRVWTDDADAYEFA